MVGGTAASAEFLHDPGMAAAGCARKPCGGLGIPCS